MSEDNNYIEDSRNRTEQLKRQRRLQKNREMTHQKKIDTRRKIIVGGIVIKYFPIILDIMPQLNEAANAIEFAKLEMAISMLANDEDYLARLLEKVKHYTSSK